MMIQSLSKSPSSTRVVVMDIDRQSDAQILAFIGTRPTGTFDHTIRRADDFSGEVTRQSASVVFWTD